jgi:ABC-2 type transport system permease protein
VSTPADSATFELREIRGPSAFGGEWQRFWNLVWLTAAADYKTRYLHSWLGYGWSLLRPLLLFGVLYVVFSQVIRFGDQVDNYAALLLFNIMLFQFFADATGGAVRCVAQRESLVRKMQFPRIVIPFSVILNALLTTIMNMIAALLLITAIGVEPRATWLLLPLVLLALLVLVTGVSLALSALFPRFRDVEQIWTVFSRALFYGTPILYPIEFVPEGFRSLVAVLNPLVPIFEQARIWVLDPDAPSIVDVAGGPLGLAISAAIIAATCAVGLWIFEREAPRVAEEL